MSSVTSPQWFDNNDPQPHPSLVIPTEGDRVVRLEYLLDGRRVVTGSRKTVRTWNLESREQEGPPMEHENGMSDFAVTRDGTKIISSDDDGRIKVWDVASHKLVKEWTHPESYPGIAISQDDRLVAVGDGKMVGIYNMEGVRVNRFTKIGRGTLSMCFSPDGNKLACGTEDGIRVYDVNNGRIIGPLDGFVTVVLWSRDGSRLFSGSEDGTIHCWNSVTGQQIGHPWSGHTGTISSLSLSPLDGSILASASLDHTVRFWNATTGNPIGQHLQHDEKVCTIRFSPSGGLVASAGRHGKIYIWRSQIFNFDPNFPPPLDLTRYIFRTGDRYVDGGVFADVYRCWYRDEEVAVKAFRFSFAMDGDVNDRSAKKLCRELGIWRRLDHPNVVPFLGVAYGFGMHEAMSFVSLWMPHGSLHHFLAKNNRNLGLQHRLRFLLDIANGLHYLHSFPFFHGGLNSNNVLLDADCIARLAGFGYSSLLGNIPEALTYLQRSTARSGALRWIAPEQVDPEESFKLTTKTDIYSFGCVALQVLSGRKPWSEVQMDSIVVLRLMQGHKPGRPESRTLNDTHWHLIQDCWSAIEERPSAEEIIFTIDQFLSHCPQSPPLRDLLPVWSSGANPGVGSSSSLSQAFIEGSSTHIIQAAIEDDQNSIASPSGITSLNRPHESEKRRMSLTRKHSGIAEPNDHPWTSPNFPRPPDLTRYVCKVNDHYVAGGAFGDVYRCRYFDGSPKEVAVKALRFMFAMDGGVNNRPHEMLRRELGIWRRLDHINVVPFLGVTYGFGMHEAVSLVSLWMPHGSLHRFLVKNNRNLGLQHRLRFLLDIANGLHYLHSFPFVHGDLNSNNVLLDGDYTARLADFGYASLVGNAPEALTYLQRSTARHGALRWIAPEQVDGEGTFNSTTKTDIYSFGCVALQVLSGKQPWSEVQGGSAIVLRLVQRQNPGRPDSRTLSDSHWDLIQNCWSAVKERPAAEVIISTINQFLSKCPQSPPLCDLFPGWSSQADLGAETSSSLSQAPIEGSSTHITEAASKDD